MESNGPDFKSGNKYAFRAAFGKPGNTNSPVWVAWMLVPFGMLTLMTFVVGKMLSHGLMMCKKFPVLPESIIAKC